MKSAMAIWSGPGDSGDSSGVDAARDGRGGPESLVIAVREETEVGTARRAAARMASEAGLSESDSGSLALVVTEAAMNIARYGGGGSIILSDLRARGRNFIEMIAVDKGRGISDMTRALSDGYSTGGTPGKGLGAIRRMSGEFDLWSAPSLGTVLVARVPVSKRESESGSNSGVVCTAIHGESVCGDAWLIESLREGLIIAVADGLGHGRDAAIAADAALDVVRRRKASSLADIFDFSSRALRATRGAALQVVKINLQSNTITSAGVGNISTSVSTHAQSKSLPSQPGIVGHQMPRVREQVIPWASDSMLVMHSDGVSARWKLETYPGLRARDPALTAAVLHRDFARTRDDATVLTYRGT